MLVEAGIAVLGAAAGQLIRYVICWKRKKNVAVKQWYGDVISSLSYGHGVCDMGRDRSNLNYGSIAEESKKVSLRLKEHINSIPSGVDEESEKLVREVETCFHKLSVTTETSDDQSTRDAIRELFEIGQRDLARNKDIDMGSAVVDLSEYSPLMANILDQADADAQRFGMQLDEQFGNAESFEELFEMVQSEHGVSKRSVDRILDAQFLTDKWDKNLSKGIRVLLQITLNKCIEAINHVGEVSHKSTAN